MSFLDLRMNALGGCSLLGALGSALGCGLVVVPRESTSGDSGTTTTSGTAGSGAGGSISGSSGFSGFGGPGGQGWYPGIALARTAAPS